MSKGRAELLSLGTRIRERRRELGLSQEALADLAGVHRTYVGMVERGEKNVTYTNLRRFARALGLSLSELMGDL